MAPGAKVIAVDVETCIGVVHVVDKVLIADDALNSTTSEPAEMEGTTLFSTSIYGIHCFTAPVVFVINGNKTLPDRRLFES